MIKIREYSGDDYYSLLSLLSSVYNSSIEQAILEEYYNRGDRKIMVAEDVKIEKIVGSVFTEIQTDYVRQSKIVFVTYLAVDEKYRGKGIGRQIMQNVESMCKEYGCSSVELTSADFRTGAHAFYNAMGYTKKKTTHFIKEIK